MTTPNVLQNLRSSFPDLAFEAGDVFQWSPKSRTVYYADARDTAENIWSLLHETGHAALNHRHYQSDYQLLQMELSAWQWAKSFAASLGMTIDAEHIEDCLDTYRDWLHKRSACPTCTTTSLEWKTGEYRCHNCYTTWSVSTDRFCRPYRRLRT